MSFRIQTPIVIFSAFISKSDRFFKWLFKLLRFEVQEECMIVNKKVRLEVIK